MPTLAFLRSATAFGIGFPLLCLVFGSAVWIESDAYRYAGGLLALLGFWDYFRTPLHLRVSIGWVGFACFGWAGYVALRYGWTMVMHPDAPRGSAEGLYLFPVAFTILGYALYRYRGHLSRLPDLFMLISFLTLGSTLSFATVASGLRSPFLFQNNTIHASVAAGLIVIAALAYVEQASRGKGRGFSGRTAVRVLLGLAVLALALTGIYGARSKGVWLALGLTLPLQLALMFLRLPRGRALAAAGLTAAAAILAGFTVFGDMLHELSAPTASALSLLDMAVLNDEGIAAIHALIRSGTVPFSFGERLMLWMNALEIVTVHPLFGAGIRWREVWNTATYADIPYNLMHNGYVEILIRYGLSGLLFFLALYGVFLDWVLRAWRGRLVPAMAAKIWIFSTLFFALTLLTNSNNRLAIGESFILISAAFAFCCLYLHQHAQNGRIR